MGSTGNGNAPLALTGRSNAQRKKFYQKHIPKVLEALRASSQTAKSIQALLCVSKSTSNGVLSVMHELGYMHIQRWIDNPGSPIRVFAYGPGVDAEYVTKNPSQTLEIKARAAERKRKAALPAVRDPLIEALFGKWEKESI